MYWNSYIIPFVAVLLHVALPASAATFLVTNTNDSGMGSLRQAINDANNLPGDDRIEFNIPGDGPHTIAPLSGLPGILDSLTVDGYTQPGAAPATDTGPATLEIVVDGINSQSTAGISVFGDFRAGGVDVVLRGLVIHRWNRCVDVGGGRDRPASVALLGNYIGTDASGTRFRACAQAVRLTSIYDARIGGATAADRNVIAASITGIASQGPGSVAAITGNYIGTDPTGSVALNAGGGTGISGSENDVIGGTAPGAGNLISGMGTGITANGGARILGNRIGTDASGMQALGNGIGILLFRNNTVVGGSAPGAGNLISGNTGAGIIWGEGLDNVIQGNLIGTDASGMAPLGNLGAGLFFDSRSSPDSPNTVGGTAPGEGNVIAFNGGPGVLVDGFIDRRGTRGPGVPIDILGNTIFANGGLGIDLSADDGAGDGVTANDPGDADTLGGSRLQNYPVLAAAATDGMSSIAIDGSLNGLPDTADYRIEFFASAVCNAIADGSPDPDISEDFGEGETFLGATSVDTDSSGDATFSVNLAAAVPEGNFITATATGPDGTSEFSRCIVAESVAADAQIDAIVADIDGLEANGTLNKGNANALRSKLEGARDALAKGNDGAARNKLDAFINQVEAFSNTGTLIVADGQNLINAARVTIDSIQG